MFDGSNNVFSFMSSGKGTPAYWKQFLYDVIAMFKQLRISEYFPYFLSLLLANLKWEELPYSTNKLNNLDLNDGKLKV